MAQLSKIIECTTPSTSPNVNCGPWVIMTCRYRFSDCNKRPAVVKDVGSGGKLRACAGTGCVRALCTSCSVLLWT